MKRILLLKADGTEAQLAPSKVTYNDIRRMVGGLVEHVRVLDHIRNVIDKESGVMQRQFVLTSMFVNEEGLLKDLPRNERATKIYQRLTRAQFPDAANPFQASKDAMRKRYESRGFVVEMPEPVEGYDEDPFVVGDVVFFEGYTCEEVDNLFFD